MQIGSFFRTANGYEGIIETATLDIRISIVPAEQSDADKAPDWRVLRGDGGEGTEIGAGWNETGERAGDYVSLRQPQLQRCRPGPRTALGARSSTPASVRPPGAAHRRVSCRLRFP